MLLIWPLSIPISDKVMRPGISALEDTVKRRDVFILRWGAGADESETCAQNRYGLSEPVACTLRIVVALGRKP